MRAARQQTASRRTLELPPVSGARNRNSAASSSASARKNRLGCVARNFEASPNNCGPRGLSLRARSGGGFCRDRIAIVRRLPSEPAEYADGAGDARHVCEGVATHPPIPRSKLTNKHRAHREHRAHEGENVDVEARRPVSCAEKKCRDWMTELAARADRPSRGAISTLSPRCNSTRFK